MNITSDQKVEVLDAAGSSSGARRVEQGAECQLQPNKLVSPLHTQIFVQPDTDVCGYYFPPGQSSRRHGAADRRADEHRRARLPHRTADAVVVRRARLRPDRHARRRRCPQGTLWVPMAQGQKHWIQAILGEDPYLPYPVQLRRHAVVVPAHARHRRQRLPDAPLPPGVGADRDHDPGFGTVTGAGSAGLRVRHRLGAGRSAWSMDLLGQGREGLPRGGDVQRRRPRVRDRRGARRRRVARAAPTSRRSPPTRETPVYGLPRYPVDRYALPKPKIGLFTGGATAPANPIPIGGDAKGDCTRRLLRGAVRAHAEDEDPASS